MEKLILPRHVRRIMEHLNNNGHQVFLVGGCVRDTLLGKVPHDWDITTSAHPEKVMELFPRSYAIGLKFGTVGVAEDGILTEVTTLRTESGYDDFRHPSRVEYAAHLADDLSRRDFTVNAMALSLSGELIDLFGGRADLEKGSIRAVGDPAERFREDPLRMLRAIRFSAALGFTIEQHTFEAMRSRAELCRFISAERICSELEKLLTSPRPENLSLLFTSGLSDFLIPCRIPDADRLHRLLTVISGLENDFAIRLGAAAAILKYISDADCSFINSLKASRSVSRTALAVADAFNEKISPDRHVFSCLIKQYGIESVRAALQLQCLTDQAEGGFPHSRENLTALCREWDAGGLEMSDLAVSGKDLADLGLTGVKIGKALELLHNVILDDIGMNSREKLLQIIKNIIAETEI